MLPGGHPDAAGKTSQSALTWRTGTGARRAALFASRLQRSDAPTAEMVATAIKTTVRQLGVHGCVSRMAQEFGEVESHHDCAAARSARLHCPPCSRAAGGVT